MTLKEVQDLYDEGVRLRTEYAARDNPEAYGPIINRINETLKEMEEAMDQLRAELEEKDERFN